MSVSGQSRAGLRPFAYARTRICRPTASARVAAGCATALYEVCASGRPCRVYAYGRSVGRCEWGPLARTLASAPEPATAPRRWRVSRAPSSRQKQPRSQRLRPVRAPSPQQSTARAQAELASLQHTSVTEATAVIATRLHPPSDRITRRTPPAPNSLRRHNVGARRRPVSKCAPRKSRRNYISGRLSGVGASEWLRGWRLVVVH